MFLTNNKKEILEKACKRSSPMDVRKQLVSAFGSAFDEEFHDAVGDHNIIAEPMVEPVLGVPASDILLRLTDLGVNMNISNDRVRARMENQRSKLNRYLVVLESRVNEILNFVNEIDIRSGGPGWRDVNERKIVNQAHDNYSEGRRPISPS